MMQYGMFIITKNKPARNLMHYTHHYIPGSSVRISLKEELKHTGHYFRFKGEIIGVDKKKTEGDILIRFSKDQLSQPLRLGVCILTSTEPKEIGKALNPAAFDFREYSRKKGIYHQLSLSQEQFTTLPAEQMHVRTLALICRGRIIKSLGDKGFTSKEFSVIEALLLGKRQDLSKETMSSYQNAGAMHLLAISGLHIGILLMILQIVLGPFERLRHGKEIKWVLLIGFLWFFAFISGLSPSVIRAATMFTVLSFGIRIGRFSQLGNYLFIALFLSLVFKPLYVFDLGFQMSYLAVAAILGVSPFLKSLWNPDQKLLRYIWNLFVISISAQLGVLPLSLYHFHHFSALFFLSSIAIIPFLGIVLGMGYFMIILDFFNFLWPFYVEVYAMMITMMNHAIEIFGSINTLIFKNVFFTEPLLCISYLFIGLLTFSIRNLNVKRSAAILVCCILIFAILLFEKRTTQSEAAFIVFHQYKQSLFLRRTGDKGILYSGSEANSSKELSLVKNYARDHFLLHLSESERMLNFYKLGNYSIMVIDHSSVKSDFGFKPDILILINSPQINLDRILGEIRPKVIIADGSDFSSYKSLWEKSCKQKDIIFHDTYRDGAFTLISRS